MHGLTASVSHETLYQAVYAQGARGLERGLHMGLHRQRRRRKPRVCGPPAAKHSPLGVFKVIHDRPEIAAGRVEIPRRRSDLQRV
ncbi:MAG TPA: hypothetical protein VL068_13875 [Microthrixaceae bacterium]|nr:hypothetical protein [Microthrixaceae bacterium]